MDLCPIIFPSLLQDDPSLLPPHKLTTDYLQMVGQTHCVIFALRMCVCVCVIFEIEDITLFASMEYIFNQEEGRKLKRLWYEIRV